MFAPFVERTFDASRHRSERRQYPYYSKFSANIERPPPLPGLCAIRRPSSHFVWPFCCNSPFNIVYAQ